MYFLNITEIIYLNPLAGVETKLFFWVFSVGLFFIVCVCFLVFWVVHVSWVSGKPRQPSKTKKTSQSTTTSLFFVDFLVFLGCLVFLVVLVALAVLVSLVVLVFSVLRGVHSTNRTSDTYNYTTIPPHAGAATTAHAGGSSNTERTGTPSRE